VKQSVSVRTGLGYGLGAFGLMLFNLTVSIFLLYFYTDVLGLDSQRAGLIILVAMIWDGLTDPLMSMVAERTSTRWGRYRPFIFAGTPVLAVAFVLLFSVASVDIPRVGLLALLTTLVYRTAFTVVWMPFTTLIVAITEDYDARSTLTAYKTFFVSVAGASVSACVLFIVDWLGHGSEARGFLFASIFISALAGVGLWACCALVPERPCETLLSSRPTTVLSSVTETFRLMLSNPAFLQVFAASFLLLTGWNCLWQTTIYYFKYCVGDANLASAALAGFHVFQAAAAIVWARLTRTIDKRGVWVAGAAISVACLAVLAVQPSPSPTIAVVMVSLFGIGTSAFLVTYFSALADTVDFGEWRSGIRCEAPLFGMLAFVQKGSFGIASGIVGTALDLVGFTPNQPQTGATSDGIRFVFTLLPITGFFASGVLMLFYRLGRELHARVRAEIDGRTG